MSFPRKKYECVLPPYPPQSEVMEYLLGITDSKLFSSAITLVNVNDPPLPLFSSYYRDWQ